MDRVNRKIDDPFSFCSVGIESLVEESIDASILLKCHVAKENPINKRPPETSINKIFEKLTSRRKNFIRME